MLKKIGMLFSKTWGCDGMKVNLGCGERRMEGYINVDIVKRPSVDMVMDLSRKWKFPDSSVEEIYMDNILEHLEFWHAIKEIERVLKKGGKCTLIVPHYRSPTGYMPQHTRVFSYQFFHLGFQEDFVGLGGLDIRTVRLIPPVKALAPIATALHSLWEWLLPVSSVYVEIKKK